MVKDKKDDTKLNEYLGLMTAPSKTKTWRDGELPTLQDPKLKNHDMKDEATSAATPHIHEQPVDEVPAKRPRQDTTTHARSEAPTTNVAKEEDTVMADTAVLPPAGASDMDWMRSRTSRLLGLVDDDEDENISTMRPRSLSPAVPAEETEHEPAIVKEEKETEPVPAITAAGIQPEDVTADVVAIQASGRLFLRNLAYTVTEEELRACFAPFGTLEEVSIHPFHFSVICQRMIVQIGTTYVISHDANLAREF